MIYSANVCLFSCAAAERGESDGGDKTEPHRLTDSVVPPEDANEISGGRTNADKCCFQERRPHTNAVLA